MLGITGNLKAKIQSCAVREWLKRFVPPRLASDQGRALAAAFIVIVSSHTAEGAPITLVYDFNEGAQNWVPLFTNYPPGSETFYELAAGIQPLPAELGISGTGFMLSGNNHSDDLLMAMKRLIGPAEGVEPGRTYRLLFKVEFASNAPSNSVGVGGAPGEGVALRVGATPIEPIAVTELVGQQNYYRFSLDLLDRAGGVPTQSVIGHVGNGPSSMVAATYKRLVNQHWHDYAVTADQEGKLWIVVVNRSGFEATTRLYYLKITVQLVPVSNALFPYPTGIATDGTGKLYVSDAIKSTIQRINVASQVALVAGSADMTGFADGSGAAASFRQPGGLVYSSDGALRVTDSGNATIRRVSAAGAVTTLAGSAMVGERGYRDGVGTTARFSAPVGIAQTPDGIHYVADAYTSTVRKIYGDSTVSTFAGAPMSVGSADGNSPRFAFPSGLAADVIGNIYVADSENSVIRKISPSGQVVTLAGFAGLSGSDDGAGQEALFNHPQGLAVAPSGDIYVADTGNSSIRRVSAAGMVSTFAGLSGVRGLKDGPATEARFDHPQALALDSTGNLYVADTDNASIRRITSSGVVSTLVLSPEPADPTPQPPTPAPDPEPTTSGGGGAVGIWLYAIVGVLVLVRLRYPAGTVPVTGRARPDF